MEVCIMEKNVPARQIVMAVLLMGILLAVNAGFTLPARADWYSLTGLLPAHVSGLDYELSPDSQFVVYQADIDTEDVDELYSIPISGTTPVKLNPPLVQDGDIDRFAITPDSQFVIYIADQEVDNRKELYRVPIGGGTAVKLNGELPSGGNVQNLRIDPDNLYVVYNSDQETNDVFELWSVPIAGGTPIKLMPPMPTGGDVITYAIDPLSNRVVYTADQEVDGLGELFSVPMAGGSSVKLNPTPEPTTGNAPFFQINPVIPVVVFMARELGSTKENLWMMPTAGGVPATKLNFNLLASQRVINFRVSPAGDRVVYSVQVQGSGTPPSPSRGNLYSVLIGGGGSINLTETADAFYGVNTFEILLDGSRVVYEYKANESAFPRLETSTLGGGVRATLYQPTAGDDPLGFFRTSRDSAWVFYQTGQDVYGDLYTVPAGGGSSIRHGVGRFQATTPDSGRLLYTSVTGDNQQTDLFSAQIFGGGERDLSGMEGTGHVVDTVVSSDGSRIVFRVQIDGQYDLRVSDGLPAQPPATVTPTVTMTPTLDPTISPTPTTNPTLSPTPTVPSTPLLNLYLPMTQKS
jgi:dipeptidyl aminopeptidase/acylaminoacyl peptidase